MLAKQLYLIRGPDALLTFEKSRLTGRYDHLRKYQVKIRECVLPGAIVDGWDRSLQLT